MRRRDLGEKLVLVSVVSITMAICSRIIKKSASSIANRNGKVMMMISIRTVSGNKGTIRMLGQKQKKCVERRAKVAVLCQSNVDSMEKRK